MPDSPGRNAGADQMDTTARLLLVEDDSALRAMLNDALALQGYTVHEADSRPSALHTLQQHAGIRVMLIDLGLPPMPNNTSEGIQLIKDILRENPVAKVIVLTGQTEESAALEAIREGAFDFLSKPASLTDILGALKRAFLFNRQEISMAAEGLTRFQISARIEHGLKAVRAEAEEKLVRQVLKDTGFNVYQSAARLGLKRESIYYFLKKFGINRDD